MRKRNKAGVANTSTISPTQPKAFADADTVAPEGLLMSNLMLSLHTTIRTNCTSLQCLKPSFLFL